MALKLIQEEPSQPWYAKGVNFECTGCGQCCTGAPGYVWVTIDEIEKIAAFLNLSIKEFSQRYVRRIQDRYSLLEHPKNYDCIFLKDKKCQIYSLRPKQCRTFPWWPQHLKSEQEWQEAAKHCEGICIEAPLVPYETIQQQLTLQQNQD